jgi:hypothetical protein
MRQQPFIAVAAVVAVVGIVAFGAARASASSAPIVIAYGKTCDETVGLCAGTLNGVSIDMQVTPSRLTGNVLQLTVNERVIVGDISFTAVLSGRWVGVPEGFIVLNGTVTGGSFAGAQIHQRSDFVDRFGSTSRWTGDLTLMPASA